MKNKKELIVRHRNVLTMTKRSFGVIENRILYNLLARLPSGMNVQPELFTKNITYTFNWKELNCSFRHIHDACENFLNTKLTIKYDAKKQQYDKINPFIRCQIDGGIVQVKIAEDAIPFFLELKGGYTQYQLKAALVLSSKYSQRIFELLSGQIRHGKSVNFWVNVSIEELRDTLDIEPGKLKLKTDFENRVIKLAQKEIKEKTSISFDYKYDTDTKVGKEFKTISFTIYTRQEGSEWEELNMAIKDTVDEMPVAQKAAMIHNINAGKYRLDISKLEIILQSQRLMDKFLVVHGEIDNDQRKEILNPPGYMWSSIMNEIKAEQNENSK